MESAIARRAWPSWSGSKRSSPTAADPTSRATSSATAANASDGDDVRATSVATRRSAACSSASWVRVSRPAVLEIAIATSSVNSASRSSRPAGSPADGPATITPQAAPSTTIGTTAAHSHATPHEPTTVTRSSRSKRRICAIADPATRAASRAIAANTSDDAAPPATRPAIVRRAARLVAPSGEAISVSSEDMTDRRWKKSSRASHLVGRGSVGGHDPPVRDRSRPWNRWSVRLWVLTVKVRCADSLRATASCVRERSLA